MHLLMIKKIKQFYFLHTDNLNALIDALIKNEIVIVPPEKSITYKKR